MINRCKQVDLDDAEPGMVLSEAVLDAQRTVLLPEATVLTESLLRSLERRGIEHVLVVDNDISQEEWEAECRRVQTRLDRLFRGCRGKGASDVLLQRIAEYRMGGGK
jgi:hypothetical protein